MKDSEHARVTFEKQQVLWWTTGIIQQILLEMTIMSRRELLLFKYNRENKR